MSAQTIHDDRIATLDNEAVAYSDMATYLPTAQFDARKVRSNLEASSPHLDDSDRAVLATLEERPFSLVCEHDAQN
jgi:hypothetical protein